MGSRRWSEMPRDGTRESARSTYEMPPGSRHQPTCRRAVHKYFLAQYSNPILVLRGLPRHWVVGRANLNYASACVAPWGVGLLLVSLARWLSVRRFVLGARCQCWCLCRCCVLVLVSAPYQMVNVFSTFCGPAPSPPLGWYSSLGPSALFIRTSL